MIEVKVDVDERPVVSVTSQGQVEGAGQPLGVAERANKSRDVGDPVGHREVAGGEVGHVEAFLQDAHHLEGGAHQL